MIDKMVSDLIQVATEAKAHYQIWWAIEHNGQACFVQTLNRFRDFFEATRIAHFRSMVMAAWKPFDANFKVSSFKNLLDTNPSFLTTSDVTAIQSHLGKKNAIDGLTKIRHLFVAHQNAGLNSEQIFILANITPNDLRELIYQTGDLVNEIRRKRGWTNGVFESERGFDATIQLLAELQAGPNPAVNSDAAR